VKTEKGYERKGRNPEAICCADAPEKHLARGECQTVDVRFTKSRRGGGGNLVENKKIEVSLDGGFSVKQ